MGSRSTRITATPLASAASTIPAIPVPTQELLAQVALNHQAIMEDPNAPLASGLKVTRQVQYKQTFDRRTKGSSGQGGGGGGY